MTNSQIKSLNDLCDKLDERYGINHGGCCFIAATIASLCEIFNIEYEVVISDECGCFCEDDFYRCVANRDEYDECRGILGDTCSHYYLRIGNEFINPCYEYDEESDYILYDVDSSDLSWIYETGSWNHDYDTSVNRLIEKKLTKWFNENFSKG